jgi:serpin B
MSSHLFFVSISILCMIVVGLSGCLGPNQEKPAAPTQIASQTPTPGETGQHTGAEKSVVEANNKFAFASYSELRKDAFNNNKTLFYSPFSISSALAITYEGARGTTADEIRSVFFFPSDDNQRRMGYEQLNKGINQENSRYTLKTANALWAEKTYRFLPEYMNTARMYYRANATNLDFINQPENSRLTINTWIEDQTNNKIRDLIPGGAINPLTRLVITNAVYFKGLWAQPFDKNETRDELFTISQGKTVPVKMMVKNDTDAYFRYMENDALQVLELPYATGNNKQVSMLVILPRNYDLASVEESLTPEKLASLKNASYRQRVHVMFPKFKLDTKFNLSGTLKLLGMSAAFTENADFSGMDGSRNLFIGDIIHQAFIEVNEEGTEAAAATVVVMNVMAIRNEPPIPVFRADHPFIFIIQDNENGNILFMGRVIDPNG